ncbi:MAG: nucleotidyltransferase domain-containing protein, partial [Bacteroidetes bacterium]|nr:nucleotidyltransferase domain-containing protein [Bacteroidota bacterium]
WVFGSVLRNDFRKTSDIDFLVSFDEVNMTVREYLDYLFFLKKDLENLFQRKVDLIEYEALKNPYMIEEIDNTKKLIFYGEEQEKVSS